MLYHIAKDAPLCSKLNFGNSSHGKDPIKYDKIKSESFTIGKGNVIRKWEGDSQCLYLNFQVESKLAYLSDRPFDEVHCIKLGNLKSLPLILALANRIKHLTR